LKKTIVTPRRKLIIYSHIADNFRRWAETEYAKKSYVNALDFFEKAKDFIQKSIELEPYNYKSHRLNKKINLNFGIMLYRSGRYEEGKRILLEVTKPIQVGERMVMTDRTTEALAHLNLANFEMRRKKPNYKEIEKIIN